MYGRSIVNVGKSNSKSMLTLFESRYTHKLLKIQLFTVCCSQENSTCIKICCIHSKVEFKLFFNQFASDAI